MKTSFLFLGTGASLGVPVVGCKCHVCCSTSSFDKRFRTSGLLTCHKKQILLDCGPDFRQQALKHNISHLDGVIITHAHHDHTASIDELRVFYHHMHVPLKCLMSKETSQEVTSRFKYIFSEETHKHLKNAISLEILPEDRGEIDFEGIHFKYFSYTQAGMKVNGFRVGDFAYVTDIHNFPESLWGDLKGVKVLVVSALRFTSSDLHFTVDQSIDFAKRAEAKETWLTHLSHDLSHEKLHAYLPQNVHVAYDGLEINIPAL